MTPAQRDERIRSGAAQHQVQNLAKLNGYAWSTSTDGEYRK